MRTLSCVPSNETKSSLGKWTITLGRAPTDQGAVSKNRLVVGEEDRNTDDHQKRDVHRRNRRN